MTRHDMIERIGNTYMTSNIEGGEYSYIQEAGSRANLENALGRSISHFKLDIRFEKEDIVVLVETKNLGRIEQFDENNNSKWKVIEEDWLNLYNNKKSIDGKSATATIDGKSEWLCEAYMKTDYSKLSEEDFQKTLNNYLAYLMKEGKIYES